MLKDNETLLKYLEGKTDDEKREILIKNYKTYYDMFVGPRNTFNPECSCKFWYAQVFDYCHESELQAQLDFFFFLVNLFAHFFGFCFNHEETVYLGCTCPCWRNQVILYYTISYCD